MAYLVLARKYRPGTFDAFVGQDVISETLRNAIQLNRVAHAYLFCGPRGVGKTSMARVFAKALNCVKGPTLTPCDKCEQCKAIAAGQDVDVIEIDGASNRGIDEVRDIRQNARYAPQHSRFKIYYIDEVHMLTEPAFNALLKTLEEPPPHVKFIFATTSAAKLPDTILSRVQRFDFRRISNVDIIKKLASICKAEKLAVPADVTALVARRARGSMRDALSLLDQILSFCGEQPDHDAVAGLLGTLGDDELAALMKMIQSKDAAGLLKTASELLVRGMDVGEFIDQLTGYVRDLLVGRTCGPDADLLDRAPEGAAALVAIGKTISADRLLYVAEILNGARRRIREGQDDRIVLEMALVKLAQSEGLAPVGELIERLAALEEGAERAQPPPARPPAPPAPQYRSPAAPPQRAAAPPPRRMEASAEPELDSEPDAAVREEPPSGPPLPAPQHAAVGFAAGPPPANLGEFWQRFVSEVAGKNMWLGSQLAGAHVQRIENGEVLVAFPSDRPSAREEAEKPESRREMQTILARMLNRNVSLRMVTVKAELGRKSPVEAALSDGGIQELVQKFEGTVMP